MVVDIGRGMQSLVDYISRFFGVFREILSAFPFPILDFFGVVISLLLGFVIVRMLVRFLG